MSVKKFRVIRAFRVQKQNGYPCYETKNSVFFLSNTEYTEQTEGLRRTSYCR